MARNPQDPHRYRWQKTPGLKPSAILTSDASRPFKIQAPAEGEHPLYIVGRDGFSIIATVHRGGRELATLFAAAPELADAAEELIAAQTADDQDAVHRFRKAFTDLVTALVRARPLPPKEPSTP